MARNIVVKRIDYQATYCKRQGYFNILLSKSNIRKVANLPLPPRILLFIMYPINGMIIPIPEDIIEEETKEVKARLEHFANCSECNYWECGNHRYVKKNGDSVPGGSLLFHVRLTLGQRDFPLRRPVEPVPVN